MTNQLTKTQQDEIKSMIVREYDGVVAPLGRSTTTRALVRKGYLTITFRNWHGKVINAQRADRLSNAGIKVQVQYQLTDKARLAA